MHRVILPLVTLLVGCSGPVPTTPTPTTEAGTTRPISIAETFMTASMPADNVDSVAVAPRYGWIVSTTKGTHQLRVEDATTGAEIRRVGAEGGGAGEFRRPNGIAVAGDLVLVVERDNARLQALRLPDFEPVGIIGADVLERPYGIAVAPADGGGWNAWITDNFDLLPESLPGNPRLAERVRHFRLTDDGTMVTGELMASFGDIEGDGALWKVETIAVDPDRDLLLVAEEDERRMGLRVYTRDGRFTGRIVGAGMFAAEPEGVALWACGTDSGYWIATDQHAARTQFLVLDRESLDYVGVFTGEVTANTDGIGVTSSVIAGMPSGALYAVHDDQSVAAFDWRDIATALGLVTDCAPAATE
jgi:3-phytase